MPDRRRESRGASGGTAVAPRALALEGAETQLKRQIGLYAATAITVGNIIG